jgi:hypothetical protein
VGPELPLQHHREHVESGSDAVSPRFFAEKTVLVGLAVWVASTSRLFGNMALAHELSVYEAGLAKS